MESRVRLSNTPSLVHNNLAVSNKYLAYITTTESQVELMDLRAIDTPENQRFESCKYKGKEEVLHINYLNLKSKWYLVLGTTGSIQLWTEDGRKIIAFTNCENLGLSQNSGFLTSAVSETQELFLFGTAKGSLEVTRVEERTNTLERVYSSTGHSDAISALACLDNFAVSGDESGVVVLWDIASQSLISSFSPCSTPATSATIFNEYSAVSFGNGQINVYNLRSSCLEYTVWGHSRWVTGLCSYPSKCGFVSCSEDCCLNLWSLSQGNLGIVSCNEIANTLLTGVALWRGKVLAVAYDRSKVWIVDKFN